jgi:hypothetical protein
MLSVFPLNYTIHNGQFSVQILKVLTVAEGNSVCTSFHVLFSTSMLLNKVTSIALLSITQLMISYSVSQNENDTKTVKRNYELVCGFHVLDC